MAEKKENKTSIDRVPAATNSEAILRFRQKQHENLHPDRIFEGIRSGNLKDLSQAITLVESTQDRHRELAQSLIEKCLPFANNSLRIGVTGVPGVGKSTFIESFGLHLIAKGHKVAVLAVDPSSTISLGSILGDKTRMEELVRAQNAFIRPSPSGRSLGGVAQKTRESIIICEAAGFDTIIIETVGVGQSETAVHSMVDFFLLLKLAGAGDELQGIKRGIIEMADAIVINKADGENMNAARKAKNQFHKALHLFPPNESGWTPKVTTCSALQKLGIEEVWEMILEYKSRVVQNDYFEKRRKEQNKYWLLQTIEEQLQTSFYHQPEVKKQLPEYIEKVIQHKMTPFAAARYLLNLKKA